MAMKLPSADDASAASARGRARARAYSPWNRRVDLPVTRDKKGWRVFTACACPPFDVPEHPRKSVKCPHCGTTYAFTTLHKDGTVSGVVVRGLSAYVPPAGTPVADVTLAGLTAKKNHAVHAYMAEAKKRTRDASTCVQLASAAAAAERRLALAHMLEGDEHNEEISRASADSLAYDATLWGRVLAGARVVRVSQGGRPTLKEG